MNRRWVVLALVCLAILVAYVDRGNLSIATVEIMRDFRLSPVYAGTLLSAFFWTYGLFQIPAGFIIDRYGIRGVYAGALPADGLPRVPRRRWATASDSCWR